MAPQTLSVASLLRPSLPHLLSAYISLQPSCPPVTLCSHPSLWPFRGSLGFSLPLCTPASSHVGRNHTHPTFSLSKSPLFSSFGSHLSETQLWLPCPLSLSWRCWSQTYMDLSPSSPLTGCVTLGKSLDFSMWASPVVNGNNGTSQTD